MIKQIIFIINYPSLYEILKEIKENLSFEIINYEHVDDFIKSSHFNLKNLLIIGNPDEDLQLKKNLLKFNGLPLSIKKIVELINIELIKLRFNHQSKININQYEINFNSKFFSRNGLSLKLTEKEIEIILYLNETKTKHSILDLQKNIWGYSSEVETHTVETHIYRLRKKINDKFKDEKLILSDKEGYFIC
tara:strand:- start:414 stop:986 length:573 start_codon:yes stop_codon:yes gene_type:complete